MKYHIGLSCGFHDAGLTVISGDGEIRFASHSERYSKVKHDKDLCPEIVEDALNYVHGPYTLNYYEKPWLKLFRQIRAGQSLDYPKAERVIGKTVMDMFDNEPVNTHSHHKCHAAAGFQTSHFTDATVVVIDAIGEMDTISIWDARYNRHGIATYKKLWSKSYPDSIGLFYSAMTKRVGLKPLDEEYILMGMVAYGSNTLADIMKFEVLDSAKNFQFKNNFHIGAPDNFMKYLSDMDVAACTQKITEELICNVMKLAVKLGRSKNLVYGGGVALNCLANRLLGNYFNKIWIMPNPGDAGNSLGAAALSYGKEVAWRDAFLGHEIKGPYPVENIISELAVNKMVGVASGRSEFGPRALGNRSLLADPRGTEIKDTVNEIKRRQKFRPFAPIILEEMVHDYFVMPRHWNDSRYMQVVAPCKFPDLYPAIVHADYSSRVQTVPKDGSGIRKLLECWYSLSGCPMLLNTSLNIRGEPMVNDRVDADRFEKLYNLKVCS